MTLIKHMALDVADCDACGARISGKELQNRTQPVTACPRCGAEASNRLFVDSKAPPRTPAFIGPPENELRAVRATDIHALADLAHASRSSGLWEIAEILRGRIAQTQESFTSSLRAEEAARKRNDEKWEKMWDERDAFHRTDMAHAKRDMRNAFLTYGSHLPACVKKMRPGRDCTCGYDAKLRSVKEALVAEDRPVKP